MGSRSGPVPWVAVGSSGLIILVVVFLVTHIITPRGEPTDFDSVIRRMGANCFGQLLGPPPVPDEVASASVCQLVSGDVVMYLVAYAPRASGTVGPRAPALTPQVAQWLCRYLMGDFLYADGDDYGLAVRPTRNSQVSELSDALDLHPSWFKC